MSPGTMILSYCSSVTAPDLRAASRKVEPLAWASSAIFAAA